MTVGKDVRDGLSQDARERHSSREASADPTSFADEAGFDLSEEQLDMIAGGMAASGVRNERLIIRVV